jgi:hypothetical protein
LTFEDLDYVFTCIDGISGGYPEVVYDVRYLLFFQPSRGRALVDVTIVGDLRWNLLVVRA